MTEEKNTDLEREDEYISINFGERVTKTGKFLGFVFLFVGLYFILSEFPVFSSTVIDPNAGLLIVFVTGLLTSFHCIGMCSGFVVAYSTNSNSSIQTSNFNFKPHLKYNVGRIVSYIIAGLLAGLLGSLFTFFTDYRSYLSIFAGAFMILFGLSNFIPALRRFTTVRTPSLSKYIKNRGPLAFGLLNSLMPCGPLQAMLIFAAGTGNAIHGALTMLAFSVGTVPLMFGFGNMLSLISHKFTNRIIKISAIFVMVLGLIMLNRGLLLSGSGFNIQSISSSALSLAGLSIASESSAGLALGSIGPDGYQEINMTVDEYGWNPDSFNVVRGIPVKWNIYVEELTYCNKGLVMKEYGLRKDFSREGERVTLEFTPEKTGKFYFTCWMGMMTGDIRVVESLDQVEEEKIERREGLVTLKIKGMCCTGCATGLERRVMALDGVKSANIDYKERRGVVEYDPSKVSVDDIVSTISTGKYLAEVL